MFLANGKISSIIAQISSDRQDWFNRSSILQRTTWAFSTPKIIKASLPLAMLSLLHSIPANGLYADPVARRQFEQWQFNAYLNSSFIVYLTGPHRHLPLRTRSAASGEEVFMMSNINTENYSLAANIASQRFCISSKVTSSMCVMICHLCPNGS